MAEIVKRCRSLAFYGVPTASNGETTYIFHRMKGFDDITTSKNPREYSRKYVDEEFEQTDVIGYTPSVSFSFDRFSGNAVHDDISGIFTDEKTGANAVRPIIMVDMTDSEHGAVRREFTVVAQTEGEGTETYRYSGELRVKGELEKGTASSTDDWQTCTFAAAE